jgi:hypothetical protein
MEIMNGVQRELRKIRMRCRVFWIVLLGGIPLALLLAPINYGAAKVIGLMWVILSIATWMSPMMSICPSCHKSFHMGKFPSRWFLDQCGNCGIKLLSEREKNE